MAQGKKTGGRGKGTLNKLSSGVKSNVVGVFDRIGGREAMAEWAQENQTEFYKLYAKLLPHEISAEITNVYRASELADDELAEIIRSGRSERAADETRGSDELH